MRRSLSHATIEVCSFARRVLEADTRGIWRLFVENGRGSVGCPERQSPPVLAPSWSRSASRLRGAHNPFSLLESRHNGRRYQASLARWKEYITLTWRG